MSVGIITLCIPTVDALPPLERVILSNITTLEDNDTLKAGEQVTINVDYIFNSNRSNEFTLIFQISDDDGKTMMLNWISGIEHTPIENIEYICGNNICVEKIGEKTMSTSWLPLESGKYHITVFAWEYIDHPTSLGAPISMSLIVI